MSSIKNVILGRTHRCGSLEKQSRASDDKRNEYISPKVSFCDAAVRKPLTYKNVFSMQVPFRLLAGCLPGLNVLLDDASVSPSESLGCSMHGSSRQAKVAYATALLSHSVHALNTFHEASRRPLKHLNHKPGAPCVSSQVSRDCRVLFSMLDT